MTIALTADTAFAASATGAPPAAHGDAHATDAHSDGAHGGGHVKHIDNWFSFSFGPDKERKNGPLAFAILNFVILLILLVKVGRGRISNYLRLRYEGVRRALDEAEALRKQAQQQLADVEARASKLDKEIEEIRASVAADAEQERQRIISAAEAEANRIVEAADRTINEEVKRVRAQLERDAVNAALSAAEKLLRQQIGEGDHKRLTDEYLAGMRTIGDRN